MKNITVISLILIFSFVQFIAAQTTSKNDILTKQDKSIHLESGINLSLPVHTMMYRTHRLAIGINVRAWKKISPKWDLGIKADYDYRFIKKKSQETAESMELSNELLIKGLYRNFSLISIKPNIQFNSNSNWFWGAESGLGYAISDADSRIGMGFVHEYDGPQQFGLCSGLYFGKCFIIGPTKKKLSLSMDLTQFLAHWHAENSLGLTFKYSLIN